MVASYVYPRLLIFLLAILISVCASSNLAFPTMYSAHKLNKQGDRIQTVYDFEPVHHSISGFYCCFLSFIQVSQEAGNVDWYSHLFNNFPQFVVIHTVKGFSVVNEAVFFCCCCYIMCFKIRLKSTLADTLLLLLWLKSFWKSYSLPRKPLSNFMVTKELILLARQICAVWLVLQYFCCAYHPKTVLDE